MFLRLALASLGGQARYPASALMLTLGQFLVTGIEVIAVWALFHRFGEVQGWRIGEVAVFYGLVNCMFALADALGRGFDVLGTQFLRTGAFDRLLLRPRPVWLQLMGHDVRISRLGRLLQSLMVLGFATAQGAVVWTPQAVAVALFAALSIRSAQVVQAADLLVERPTGFAPMVELGVMASGAAEDTLKACMARIPNLASAGQRMLAEQSCVGDEQVRNALRSAPKF